MRLNKFLMATAVAGAFGLTMTAAIAAPLMLGPAPMPASTPKVLGVPINPATVQVQMLETYRNVRTFWLSRAIVR